MQNSPVTTDTPAKAHWRANLRLTGLGNAPQGE